MYTRIDVKNIPSFLLSSKSYTFLNIRVRIEGRSPIPIESEGIYVHSPSSDPPPPPISGKKYTPYLGYILSELSREISPRLQPPNTPFPRKWTLFYTPNLVMARLLHSGEPSHAFEMRGDIKVFVWGTKNSSERGYQNKKTIIVSLITDHVN